MKINSSLFVWIGILVVLIIAEILEIAGVISYQFIVGNIFFFVFAVVIIAFLAIIGAMFVGVLLSKKLYTDNNFTPFEVEMLKMKEDIAELKTMIKESKGGKNE
ncbi:MAG: hypothetical protein M1481_06295 [Candidatus Thermoplasmatota archaeon]|jgi:hypothetical protein|nr:hypothetical protein [Candidatus Thermoplasmatota archaeon]MCL5962808.1 hypothetical protein [Candidatus Thermoplasmatota archaeon]